MDVSRTGFSFYRGHETSKGWEAETEKPTNLKNHSNAIYGLYLFDFAPFVRTCDKFSSVFGYLQRTLWAHDDFVIQAREIYKLSKSGIYLICVRNVLK